MPYAWVEPELVLEHQEVSVYHVYKNDFCADGRYEYHYTTDICGRSSFDIRDLPSFHHELEHKEILRLAIERGEITAQTD